MFFSASRLTNPVPPPIPAAIGPFTVMLPTVAPTNDCVNTVMFVAADKLPSVTLPESATKIGPFKAVTEGKLNGPGPAKLNVKEDKAEPEDMVTAVEVCVSMTLEKPVVALMLKLVLTIGRAPAFNVPILPTREINVSGPP